MKTALEEGTPVVDVDGSYLYRKYKMLVDAGKHVSLPARPPPPITGWVSLTEENRLSVSSSMPSVTQGEHCSCLLWIVFLCFIVPV